jgi:hypothetical protein
MTEDTMMQVRNYTEFFISTVEPITRDEISERPLGIGDGLVRPIRPLPVSSHRRGLLVAAVAASVVLVLVGGVALLFDQAEADPPAATPSTSAAASSPADPFPSSSWSRVTPDESVFDSSDVWAITAGGPGLVVLGHHGGLASVWTSTDGTTWSRTRLDGAVIGGSANAVTAGGPGLVAVGGPAWFCEFDRGSDCEGSAVVWTSTDGVTWVLTSDDEDVFGGPGAQIMNSVTAGGPGLVAVGSTGRVEDGMDGDVDAAVWTSIDGITWSRIDHDEAVFGGGGMQSVTAGGPGLVAVGGNTIWTSVDGTTWVRVPDQNAVFDGADIDGVTAGGPGVVAVGSANGRAAVWTSANGTRWSRVLDAPILDASRLRAVSSGGPGLVAVGSTEEGEAAHLELAIAWTSVDGTTWLRVSHDEALFGQARMSGVIVWGSTVVAVGRSYDGPDKADIWTAPDSR